MCIHMESVHKKDMSPSPSPPADCDPKKACAALENSEHDSPAGKVEEVAVSSASHDRRLKLTGRGLGTKLGVGIVRLLERCP